MAERGKPGTLRPMKAKFNNADPFPEHMREAINKTLHDKGITGKWRMVLSLGQREDGAEPTEAVRWTDNFPKGLRDHITEVVGENWCLEMRLLDGYGDDTEGDDDGTVPWTAADGGGGAALTKTTSKKRLGKAAAGRASNTKTKRAASKPAKRAKAKGAARTGAKGSRR